VTKSISVQARRIAGISLRKDDVILSIKGTVGKVGILGDVNSRDVISNVTSIAKKLTEPSDPMRPPLVCSQSCIALRVRGDSQPLGNLVPA